MQSEEALLPKGIRMSGRYRSPFKHSTLTTTEEWSPPAKPSKKPLCFGVHYDSTKVPEKTW